MVGGGDGSLRCGDEVKFAWWFRDSGGPSLDWLMSRSTVLENDNLVAGGWSLVICKLPIGGYSDGLRCRYLRVTAGGMLE